MKSSQMQAMMGGNGRKRRASAVPQPSMAAPVGRPPMGLADLQREMPRAAMPKAPKLKKLPPAPKMPKRRK